MGSVLRKRLNAGGLAILIAGLLSGLEQETRFAAISAYQQADSSRRNALQVHSKTYFVDDTDWWRFQSNIYIVAAGALLIAAARARPKSNSGD